MPQIAPIDDNYIDDVIKSAGPYDQKINTTQGVKLRELIKKLRDYIEQEKSGSSGIIEVTYNELSSLIINNGLSVGQQYLLTDYKMHWKVNSDTSFSTYDSIERDGITEEALILTAISVNRLSHDAKSLVYPGDDIKYVVGVFNYEKNRELVFSEDSYNYKNINPVKGYIYKRIDNTNNCNICYDFRNFWVDLNIGDGTIKPYFAHRYFKNATILPSESSFYEPISCAIFPIKIIINSTISPPEGIYESHSFIPKTMEQLKLSVINSEIIIDLFCIMHGHKISFSDCTIRSLLFNDDSEVTAKDLNFKRVHSDIDYLEYTSISSLIDLFADPNKIKLSLKSIDNSYTNYKVVYLDEDTGAIVSQSTSN